MTRLYKRWRTAPHIGRSTLTDVQREAIARRVVQAFPLRPGYGFGHGQVNRPAYAALTLFIAEAGEEGRTLAQVARRFDPRGPMKPGRPSGMAARLYHLHEKGLIENRGKKGRAAKWVYCG